MTEFEKASSFYDRIREQVRSEDTLYNQRIIWLISMQAFLFATLGLILQAYLSNEINQSSPLLTGSFVLISITGILVAMVSNRVLSNGRVALNGLRDAWDDFAEGLGPETLALLPHPRGKHEKSARQNIWSRGISSGNLPAIFAFVWLCFLAFLIVERLDLTRFP
ncbi:hypothetical protein BOO69_17020 [Sulfitobacter alexandrii]|uniref:SMODS and SLOG-associating 2TM effector domain-containing protein n=1 Tax=Sulfitobacter alexandrii TaxID=1917485 RepID=A0A1J0WKR6_9RHOB|nr:hypothetical protein [Sulfitobacter alexandrii]APE44919.1 hypothetical protein BOO69_17020 [Sulfitobacter alexandrii]